MRGNLWLEKRWNFHRTQSRRRENGSYSVFLFLCSFVCCFPFSLLCCRLCLSGFCECCNEDIKNSAHKKNVTEKFQQVSFNDFSFFFVVYSCTWFFCIDRLITNIIYTLLLPFLIYKAIRLLWKLRFFPVSCQFISFFAQDLLMSGTSLSRRLGDTLLKKT